MKENRKQKQKQKQNKLTNKQSKQNKQSKIRLIKFLLNDIMHKTGVIQCVY
jgi:hypothetical protein